MLSGKKKHRETKSKNNPVQLVVRAPLTCSAQAKPLPIASKLRLATRNRHTMRITLTETSFLGVEFLDFQEHRGGLLLLLLLF